MDMGMKMMMGFMAFLNFALYVVRAVMAGIMQNDDLENVFSRDQNRVTPILVESTLFACMLGFASTKMAWMHMTEWNTSTRSSGMAVGMVALMIELLTMGYGIKQWNLGDGPMGSLGARPHFLSVSTIIQVGIKFLYVCMVHYSKAVMNNMPMEMDEKEMEDDPEVGKKEAEETAPPETAAVDA